MNQNLIERIRELQELHKDIELNELHDSPKYQKLCALNAELGEFLKEPLSQYNDGLISSYEFVLKIAGLYLSA